MEADVLHQGAKIFPEEGEGCRTKDQGRAQSAEVHSAAENDHGSDPVTVHGGVNVLRGEACATDSEQ